MADHAQVGDQLTMLALWGRGRFPDLAKWDPASDKQHWQAPCFVEGWHACGANFLRDGNYQLESVRSGMALELAVEGVPVGGGGRGGSGGGFGGGGFGGAPAAQAQPVGPVILTQPAARVARRTAAPTQPAAQCHSADLGAPTHPADELDEAAVVVAGFRRRGKRPDSAAGGRPGLSQLACGQY